MSSSKTKLTIGALVAAALTCALVGSSGCFDNPNMDEGRFPVCKTDDDCKARDAGTDVTICWNLKCVECLYDTDCAAGSYCTKDKTCSSLSPRPADEPGPKGWDPASFDECTKACKDEACVEGCNQRFPDKKPGRKK
jgi:Cys-rich repeat protein